MSAPSLQSIAAALGGRVIRGRIPHVAAPFPGRKKHDRSMHVFINGEDIGVHIFRDGVDAIAIKDHVRRVCGLPAWQPRRRKPKPKAAVPLAVRNHFFGETLAVCRLRRKIPDEHFALLINDLRLRCDAKDAIKYSSEFGFSAAEIEQCLSATPRHYTADERAKILNLTYAERQQLGLRRTGSIDVDKAGRERARRDRYNAKRRATRAGAQCLGVNKSSPVEGSLEEKKEREEVVIKTAAAPEFSAKIMPIRGCAAVRAADLQSVTVGGLWPRCKVTASEEFARHLAKARGSPGRFDAALARARRWRAKRIVFDAIEGKTNISNRAGYSR